MRATPPSPSAQPNPLAEKLGEEFFRRIPRRPGVYFLHHRDGSILYIGKARDLRSRLTWYKGARAGTAPEHTLELIESVARIRWEEHASEEEARLRESELLHAVRPPFNIAETWPQDYLYIGLRVEPLPRRPGRVRAFFQLTSRRELARDYRIFGCFKHRRRTKTGYTALLRLLYASAADGRKRFSFPSKVTRSSPPYLYSLEVPSGLVPPLRRFLEGKDLGLLRRLVELLLENEAIPRFMRLGLQEDLDVARDFFRRGPEATYRLKQLHELRGVISHRRMDAILRGSCIEREREG